MLPRNAFHQSHVRNLAQQSGVLHPRVGQVIQPDAGQPPSTVIHSGFHHFRAGIFGAAHANVDWLHLGVVIHQRTAAGHVVDRAAVCLQPLQGDDHIGHQPPGGRLASDMVR